MSYLSYFWGAPEKVNRDYLSMSADEIAQYQSTTNLTGATDGYFNGLTAVALYVTNSAIVTALAVGKLRGVSGVPTVVPGTASGVPTTLTISGTDTAGVITLTTGANTVGSATILAVTFSSPYASTPFMSLTAGNEATAAEMPKMFISSTASGFSLVSGVNQPPSSTTLVWYYHTIQ